MKKKEGRRQEKGAIEMIEEATHLLRLMPLRITALYYIGSLPFVLGLLYFIADMSKSAFAYQHEAEATFLMVLLFLWMKCWQAVFCNCALSYKSEAPAPKWSLSEIVRLCITQTAVQPLGFIVLPVALIITLPFGYAYAFFQNVLLLGNGMQGRKDGGMKALYLDALDQAMIFPRQNHLFLLIIFLFGLFVFLNVVIVMFMAPQMLKSFLGMETAFTLAGWGLFNTTFFAAAFGLTYLIVDPLVKTVYILRCFYGKSLHTGEDLKMALHRLRPAATGMAALIAVLFFLQASVPSSAFEQQKQAKEAGLSTVDLDRSLGKVIGKKEYAWRLPREEVKKEERGPFAVFIKGAIDTVADCLRTFKEWVGDVLDWIAEHIFKHFKFAPPEPADRGWSGSAQILLYVLAAIAACILAVFVFRIMKRKTPPAEITGMAVPQPRDLSSEEITADELPSDEWLALAQQMAAKGDIRLAVRALYLGSLAHLALHGIVTIAKYKSNHDYEKELRRRAAEAPDLHSAFSDNITIFENIWYGMHDISHEAYRVFNKNHERIMAIADRF